MIKRRNNHRRRAVPVEEAIRLYDKLGTWARVARVLKRPDGTRFTTHGIFNAVRWRDRGNAGFIT